MSDNDITSVAALISVILRRKATRIVDVKWLVKNEEYAREIIQISREQGQDDLTEYADHLEKLMFGSNPSADSTPPAKANGLMGGIDKLTKYAAELSAAKNRPYMDELDNAPSTQAEAPKPGNSANENDNGDDGGADTSKYIGHLR